MMFNEWDLLDRFELAARAGFRAVEIQQPYSEPASTIARELARHDLSAELLNLPAALAAVPGQESEFRDALARALEYADATGCPRLHCLAGRSDDPAAEATFVANLNRAATDVDRHGVRLMLEPLNTRDNPGYFLTGSAQARRIIDQVEGDHVALQFDFYHIQIMEGFLAETMRAALRLVRHLLPATVAVVETLPGNKQAW